MKVRKRWIAAVAALVAAVGAGVAYAAVPGSSRAVGHWEPGTGSQGKASR
jgi:hypothetical protein